MSEFEKLKSILAEIRKRTDFVPDVALVLGSGLGDFADDLETAAVIDYKDLPGFPVSTAPYHKGRFVFGNVGGVKTVVMQGRVHYYEGYKPSEAVMPVRLMKMMGAKVLFLTNASGGINFDYKPGDFMLIEDHIMNVPSPLIGANVDELGVRFPDMSNVYDKTLRETVKATAARIGQKLHEGVYIQMQGPQYESKAEIRMARTMGADAVGMSTAVEAVAAAHCGLKTVAISCVSNLACGVGNAPLSQEEVEETAKKVSKEFKALITEAVKDISADL
ncbi:MAG: purine-nucleoside phosphorylase [Ruminococcus sp.]|jgi:purine-nucleoside phosphorylase|nr:purine-nucleoside phosphorylase [Ruminococcus sp.]